MDQKKNQNQKLDHYKGLKYMGYRLSQLPATYQLADLIRYAKFQLAIKNRKLLKDPIWDLYTVEELLMEFFGHQFNESKEFREKFEKEMGDVNGEVDDFAAWADKQIAEEAKLREKTLSGMKDSISFNPNRVMGEDDE